MSVQPPILSIDPSMTSLGYAILQGEVLQSAGFIKQQTSSSVDYHARGAYMAAEVIRIISVLEPPVPLLDVVIEAPANWFDSRGTASKDSEAVQKLYYQVGLLVGMLCNHDAVRSVWCCTPGQWKGQTPKPIMVTRSQRFTAAQGIFLPDHVPHDVHEAILLGRWASKLRVVETGEFIEPLVAVFERNKLSGGTFTHEDFVHGE